MGNQATEDQRAVSPVIGVILMVAVTVIIAAVIGSSAMGIADSTDGAMAPNTNLEINQYNETFSTWRGGEDWEGIVVEITHGGGDTINTEDIRVEVNGDAAFWIYPGDSTDKAPGGTSRTNLVWNTGSRELTAGDSSTYMASIDEKEAFSVSRTWSRQAINQESEGEPIVLVKEHSHDTEAIDENVEIKKGDSIRVVWDGSDGQSQTLAEHEVR